MKEQEIMMEKHWTVSLTSEALKDYQQRESKRKYSKSRI